MHHHCRLNWIYYLTSIRDDDKEYLQGVNESDIASLRGAAYTFASLYVNHGRYREADTMYQRALAGYKKALRPNHPSTLNTIDNLGILYSNQGRLAEAETVCQRAPAGKEKALGPDHPSTLNTVNNLGNLYKDQGRLAEAEAMYQRHQSWARKGSAVVEAGNTSN